jgi:hypothetical protein
VRWMLLGAAGDCWGRVGELARLLAVAAGRCGGRLARVTADDRPGNLDVDQAGVEAESQRKWHGKRQVPLGSRVRVRARARVRVRVWCGPGQGQGRAESMVTQSVGGPGVMWSP